MSNIIFEIKNLTIINLNYLFSFANLKTLQFMELNEITNQKDKVKLLKHYFYVNFLDAYSKRTRKNILLYCTDYNNCLKDFNTIISLLKNKIKFPTVISNISIEEYVKLLTDDCPEYDDITNNNFNFIDNFNKFKEHLKKSGLLFLNKKYKNLEEEIGLLLPQIKP